MEILKGILLVLHFLGLAGLLGGWFLQLKVIGRGEVEIPAGMVHSGWLMLLTGVAMFGINEVMFEVGMSLHIKIGVKLVLLAAVMVLLMLNRKKRPVPSGIMWTAGLLTLANVAIAVLWR